LTFSTVYYPKEVLAQYLPSFLVNVASVNPLSVAAEALREFAFKGNPIQPNAIITLILTSIPFAIFGALAYYRALHKFQVKGKL
jgi:ABC-type polysaccharide/polyol phosphate export permease